MKVEALKSFEKDIAKVNDKPLARKVLTTISDLETYKTLSEIPHLKKLRQKDNYYRIRIGNHRLGIKIVNNTVFLIRFLDRKDIYKFFP